MPTTTSTKASAIISYPGDPEKNHGLKLELQDVTVTPDLKDDELLVKVVATGICHTDLVVGGLPEAYGGVYPRVLGHEGKLSTSHSPRITILTTKHRCWLCTGCRLKSQGGCSRGCGAPLLFFLRYMQ